MGSDEITVAMQRVGAQRARQPRRLADGGGATMGLVWGCLACDARLAGPPPAAWRRLQAGAAPVAAATVPEMRIHA